MENDWRNLDLSEFEKAMAKVKEQNKQRLKVKNNHCISLEVSELDLKMALAHDIEMKYNLSFPNALHIVTLVRDAFK